MSAQRERVVGLDVFRSLAILCVLACHCLILLSGDHETTTVGNAIDCLGVFGVELFFVLSGLLIGGILIRDVEESGAEIGTVRGFWLRRWYRTLPNYYFYLALLLVCERPWKHPIDHLYRYPVFMQNFVWSMGHFFSVSWSLCIEEWFYLLFPLLVLFLAQFVRETARVIFTAAIIFLISGFVVRLTTGGHDWIFTRTIVVCRLDAIAMGVVLACLRRYCQALWDLLCSGWTLVAGVAGVAAVCVYMAWAEYHQPASRAGLENALFFETADISCALLLPWFSRLTYLPQPARLAFTWISVLSYSLYLSQMTAATLLGLVLGKFQWRLPVLLQVFLSQTCTLGLACLSYWLVERTFLRFREKIRPARQSVAKPQLQV